MISPPGDAVRGMAPRPALTSGLWTVVLAAGGARRFGRLKLLRRIGTASLLQRAVRGAAAVTEGRCVVVLGCGASRLRGEMKGQRVQVVVNRRWREGMASSLQVALSVLPARATAALVVLADQYALEPRDLRRLAAAWSRAPSGAVAAAVDGLPAAPAILPRRWFARVMDLRGDQGARRLLRDAFPPVALVPMPGAAVDLDARQELAAFRRAAWRGACRGHRELAKGRVGRYIR
jgi:molybdenum cofactor cytidylyltransferase